MAEDNNNPKAPETSGDVTQGADKPAETSASADQHNPETSSPDTDATTEPVSAEAVDATPEVSEEASPVQDEKEATPAPVVSEAPVSEKKTDDDDDDDQEFGDNPNANVGEHDEFDWDLGNLMVPEYSKAKRAEMEEVYEKTLTSVENNEIVKGRVVTITDSDVVLDIGFKSDGLVATSEFRDLPDLATGDEVEVYVVAREDKRGQLVLSRKNARLMIAWDRIVDSYENDTVVKGKIVSKTKGGLIVDVMGLETFLPGSQIDVKPIIDYDSYVGKTMEFKVVKINEAIKNAVVSHKALIESDLEEQRMQIISTLEKGQVLEGTVKNITDFGAFIDLGGVDGLLYITDISWGRVNHPSEVLEINQEINVVVLDFDDEKKRISLGLKQLQKHPWEVLGDSIAENATVKGKVVNIEDYGAFLEITPGVEGLIHVSEVSWSNQPVNAREFFTLGEEREAKIVTLDREERKMSLSIKQLGDDPWAQIGERFPINSRHSGTVRNLTPYGVFVELDEFAGGMVHVSDLSWIKRFGHPSEFCKVGDELEVIIMEIDHENRKMSLSHKHVEEDPWDTFETVFPVGSVHEATVLKKDDRGAVVSLQYGLEAFAPIKHLKKEDGTMVEADETVEFKIIEFERNDKRIIVSHSRVVREKEEEAKQVDRQDRQKRRKDTQKSMDRLTRNVEKSTLGDLSALSDLKQQLEEQERAGDEPEDDK